MRCHGVKPLAILIALSLNVAPLTAQEAKLRRELLVQDARQLLRAIESAHPDPFTACGGRIPFHRNFQKVLASIPADGATVAEFHRLLLPFVAAVGDGHTAIRPPEGTSATPSGLPLRFGIVEQALYVRNEISLDGRSLLGARLRSLEGVGFEELLRRQNSLRGIENVYGTMALLGRSLQSRESLAMILPEWDGGSRLRCGLLLADGSSREFVVPLGGKNPAATALPPSRAHLPANEGTDVSFAFLDEKRETALLSVRDMMAYREGCETWVADGLSEADGFIRAAYERLHGTEPPGDLRDALAGIPSAAETFRDLALAMREAGTRNLIVDLRDNGGGNGYMIRVLLYILFGEHAMRANDEGYSIVRYSELALQNYGSIDLRRLNEGRAVPLELGDYDFSEEERYEARGEQSVLPAAEIDAEIAKSPTFKSLCASGCCAGIYQPARILVLSTPLTYSSGFNLMTALRKHGALLVGTPSAQPGNNYGDSLMLRLTTSGIQAFIAYKQIVAFPHDPAAGRLLPVDHPLTYAGLASYGFDPNSELLLALDVIASKP